MGCCQAYDLRGLKISASRRILKSRIRCQGDWNVEHCRSLQAMAELGAVARSEPSFRRDLRKHTEIIADRERITGNTHGAVWQGQSWRQQRTGDMHKRRRIDGVGSSASAYCIAGPPPTESQSEIR
jgi:hypothetical protein